ncbi:Vitamin B12 transporter BtuB [Sporomusa rhizae]
MKNGKVIADRSISNVSPKASFHYKADSKVTLYASAGKAFNSPTIMNIAFDYVNLGANSELQPEEITSYEIGAYLTASPKTTTKIAVFKNNVSNLIYQNTTKKRWEQADAEILGFELEFKHKFTPELSGFINYTYNDTEFTKFTKDPTCTGNRIPTVPMDTLTFGCTYAKDKWTTNLLGRYIGTAYENEQNTIGFMSHFVADVKLNYAMSKNTSLALSIDNIFDKKYSQRLDNFDIYAPGRVAYLELTQKF